MGIRLDNLTDREALIMRAAGEIHFENMETLSSRLSEAESLLRELEWASVADRCLICQKREHEGHTPDCRLNKFLEKK